MATPHRADPVNQEAHRVHLLAQDAGGEWERRWMAAMHAFVRRDGRDPTDARQVRTLAAEIGVPGVRQLQEGAGALDARLEANTNRAFADGAVGVPFVRFDGEAYWGNDRLVWLEARLAGKAMPASL